MATGISTKLAGQIGEYLVCAELGKRGLIATSFTGNVPEFDLLVADNDLNTLPIQVKASRSGNWPTKADYWIDIKIDDINQSQVDNGDAEIANPDLIYVCVLIADPARKEHDRYFILQKSDLQKICASNYRTYMTDKNWKRPRNYKSLDNRYYLENLTPFEDNWGLILHRHKN